MKTYLMAAGIALATVVASVAVVAQDQVAAAEIIVSAEFKKNWERGNSLEAEGLRDLQKAQRELVKQSAAVVNAQDLRDTSQSRADNARAAFENLTANPLIVDSKEARRWAKQVDTAATDWEKFEERRDEGAKDLTRAQRRQERAQTDVAKAQGMIDEGRALKIDAERASRVLGAV